jgi:hypothetical protein
VPSSSAARGTARCWRRSSCAPASRSPPTRWPVYERVEQRFIAPARKRLGGQAWEAASAAGRSLTADAAIALALEPALSPTP